MPSDWRSLLDRVAPLLEGALSGPFRGMALRFMAEKLLGEVPDNAEEAVSQYVDKGGPDLIPKLQSLDQEFQKEMAACGITEKQLLEDEVRKEKSERTPALLAGAITLGIFGMLVLIVFIPVPRESSDIINIMLGALSSGWMSIVGYYFGFSRAQNNAQKPKQ